MAELKTSHRARKRFGQNFLTDTTVLEKIVQAIAPSATDKLIEIGPGQGALTGRLINQVGEFHAIEIDRDLAVMLTQQFEQKNNFHLHVDDVLKVDFDTLLSAENPARIVGNLPYNISTPLIFHLLHYLPGIRDLLFMLQIEVVERMAAGPGSKNYGRLSIMVQYFCRVEKLFNVSPSAFTPAPKVESAIVKLTPHQDYYDAEISTDALSSLLRDAFAHRRKTLRNNLKNLISADELTAMNINPALRPENLSLEDFVKICKYLN